MKLSTFNIANFRVDGGAMFGVVPKALWAKVAQADENNNIVLSLRSLVVETEDKVILVDAGWGDKQDEKFFRYSYIHGGEGLTGGLEKCGYKPEDITDIIITHLHADHCGGCFRNDGDGNTVPVFPSATYHISGAQWDWANKSNIREEDAFLPENIRPFGESGKLNLIGSDGLLFNNVGIRICNGHTPGLIVPVINYRGKTFIYTGDLIPTTAHIHPVWNMAYDLDPLETIREKEEILHDALVNGHILLFQHDPVTECCALAETPKGIRAGEKHDLKYYL